MSIRERETSALAVKEKETGTIEQLIMTPAQTGKMLLAKTLPVFVLIMVVCSSRSEQGCWCSECQSVGICGCSHWLGLSRRWPESELA